MIPLNFSFPFLFVSFSFSSSIGIIVPIRTQFSVLSSHLRCVLGVGGIYHCILGSGYGTITSNDELLLRGVKGVYGSTRRKKPGKGRHQHYIILRQGTRLYRRGSMNWSTGRYGGTGLNRNLGLVSRQHALLQEQHHGAGLRGATLRGHPAARAVALAAHVLLKDNVQSFQSFRTFRTGLNGKPHTFGVEPHSMRLRLDRVCTGALNSPP